MKLSIYARLVISYLVFSAMLAGVSFFFIFQLNRFNQVIGSIVMDDTAAMELSGRLTDVLLSEARNERKYALLNDEQFYRNYLEAGAEFERMLHKGLAGTTGAELSKRLQTVADRHLEFVRLVEEERQWRQDRVRYSVAEHNEAKRKIVAGLLKFLQEIQQESEKDVFAKIKTLRDTGDRSGGIAILITLGALGTGLLVAGLITRSITRPLRLIEAKTREIAKGEFQCDLLIESPPSIKELALALNSMCRSLLEVDNMKAAFFAHMSHELRTPLASIKEGTNILLDRLSGEINEKQQRILKIIAQESARLITLVNSLLDLTKMEAGMMAYNFVRADLADLVREALKGLYPLAEARGIRISSDIAGLPQVRVDRERIIQVVRDLVGNAIKFTPEQGAITLTAEVRETMLEVAVRDTGIGIPKEELERIFLKFRQAKAAGEETVKGTGLGLATVKQIILAHGGRVWATSQPQKGSVFYFTLPLAQ